MGRKTSLVAGAVAAVMAWVSPGVAQAQQPVAAVFMYEVAEGLSFKAPKSPKNTAEAQRRLAEAVLLGKKIVPLTADAASPWANSDFISADAKSSVSLATGNGPIRGSFDLLKDIDPARESLDTLVISGTGTLRGNLDLSTAMQGYAGASGSWQLRRSGSGTFSGVFLIPFQIAPGVYAYLDLTEQLGLNQLGIQLCASPVPLGQGVNGCVLGADEFALGIPLTKAVLVLFD